MFNNLLGGTLNNSFDASTNTHNLYFSILRAIFEICLKRGWALPTRAALDLCKMVEKKM